MHDNGKFLVKLIHSLSQRHLFFAVWFGIVAVFVLLMVSYYKKNTRRNFRSANEGQAQAPKVDLRQLGGTDRGKQVVARDNSPVGK